MFMVCLLVSTAEFALIHLSNIFILVPALLGPFIVGWQVAMPFAFLHGLKGKGALDRSFKCIRGARMLTRTAVALAMVRTHVALCATRSTNIPTMSHGINPLHVCACSQDECTKRSAILQHQQLLRIPVLLRCVVSCLGLLLCKATFIDRDHLLRRSSSWSWWCRL